MATPAELCRDHLARYGITDDKLIARLAAESERAEADALAQGADEQEAREIAMEVLLPHFDEEETDDDEWELEGGMEDAIDGLVSWINENPDIRVSWINENPDIRGDIERANAIAMGLQPGTTKVENGVTYTLNENHRWTTGEPPASSATPHSTKEPQGSQTQTQATAKPVSGSPSPNSTTNEPSPETIKLAMTPGASDAQKAARHAVSAHYLRTKGVYWDHKLQKTMPLDPPRIRGMLKGIDFSQPVVMGPPPSIPPPDVLIQWQAEGGNRGGFFTLEGVEPQQLGIHEKAVAWNLEGKPIRPRQMKRYSTKNAKVGKVSYLASIAAPTVDTWSVPGESNEVHGGGLQFLVPVAAHPAMRIPEIKMSLDKPTIDDAIKATEALIAQAEDPPMLSILDQLKRLKAGQEFSPTIQTLVVRNYEPAMTQEIADWAQTVLDCHDG